jgi:beta-lactam-binding protein with PASTA domain
VRVPNVVGLDANAAIGRLTELALKVTVLGSRGPVERLAIATQDPVAGASLTRGTTVRLGLLGA